jgi:predicted SAM-dependent methyltransferase
MRVNLGCGPSPTPGWVNIDNSLTVRLARIPAISALIGRKSFVEAVRRSQVRYGTALHTGLPAGSADVIYSSHMLEHLDRHEARRFLAEARRLLRPGGILRLAVPDLRMIAERYARDGDADRFMTALGIELDKPAGLVARLRFAFLTGFRHHHWMYDAASLERLLASEGFGGIVRLEPGETTITDPGALDLREREDESLYLEAVMGAHS